MILWLLLFILVKNKIKKNKQRKKKKSSSSSNVGSKSYPCALICYLMSSETRRRTAKPNIQVYTVAKTLLFQTGVDKSYIH